MPNVLYAISESLGRRVLDAADPRADEYAAALKFLGGAESVLDVACGTGTFMQTYLAAHGQARVQGIDINPDNVEFCRRLGLQVQAGDALALPFADGQFDAVHCSHLLQVFTPDQAVTLLRECGRVVKKDGRIVLTTLNHFKRFWRHPENVRPYPPDALVRLFDKQKGASSPMWSGIPPLTMTGIWLRRAPLVEIEITTSRRLQRIAAVINALQYALHLRKYWAYHAYTAVFSKTE